MASIESNYSLNIARKTGEVAYGGAAHYYHFAKVELGSGLLVNVMERAKEVSARFPEADGFKVTLTYWDCRGQGIAIE